jgi:hypothetical protein
LWDIVRDDVGYVRVTMPALWPRGVTTEEVSQLGSVGAVKRRSKNDFMHHLTPHVMDPIHHRIQQPYSKWVPQLLWGLSKLRVRRQNRSTGQSCLEQLKRGTKRHNGWPTF